MSTHLTFTEYILCVSLNDIVYNVSVYLTWLASKLYIAF